MVTMPHQLQGYADYYATTSCGVFIKWKLLQLFTIGVLVVTCVLTPFVSFLSDSSAKTMMAAIFSVTCFLSIRKFGPYIDSGLREAAEQVVATHEIARAMRENMIVSK